MWAVRQVKTQQGRTSEGSVVGGPEQEGCRCATVCPGASCAPSAGGLCSHGHLLKHRVWPGIAMEKNWHLSVDQHRLQVLQFLMRLSDLLSILPRCNGFAGIQKAVVYQMGESNVSSLQYSCLENPMNGGGW